MFTKTKFIFLFLIVLLVNPLIGQSPTEDTTESFENYQFHDPMDCSNYNSFLTDETIFSNIRYFADTILPSGYIRLNPMKRDEFSSLDDLLPTLGVDNQTTFELVSSKDGVYNSTKTYSFYQQYHDGIKVEGGGIVAMNDNPGGPQHDPCFSVSAMSPAVYSNINVSSTPSVDQNGIKQILIQYFDDPTIQISTNDPKLLIIPNSDCTYSLVWEVSFNDKTVLLDAHNGNIKTVSDFDINFSENLTAKFYKEGDIFLRKNSFVPFSRIIFTDLTGRPCGRYDNGVDIVPSAPQVTPDQALIDRVTCVATALESLGMTFGDIIVGINCEGGSKAAVTNNNNLMTPAIIVLQRGDVSVDVIGHELSHLFAYQFIQGRQDEINFIRTGLSEAVADLFGIYAEEVCKGSTDWVLSNIDATIDFNDLKYPCFDDFLENGKDKDAIEERGDVIRKWFKLISDGDSSLGITGIGKVEALKLVMDALKIEGGKRDIPSFVQTLINLVIEKEGPCSDAVFNISKSFFNVCEDLEGNDYQHSGIGAGYTDCNAHISGPIVICKDNSNGALFKINDGIPGANYRWGFPIEWDVDGSSGSTYQGNYLKVKSFPPLDYYPQYFEVTAYDFTSNREIKYRVKIGCHGDGPPCDEYFDNPQYRKNNNYTLDKDISKVEIYSILGRHLFTGSYDNYQKYLTTFKKQQFGIYIYYNSNGKIIRKGKFIMN